MIDKQSVCEALGYGYVTDSDWIETVCGERDGIVHLATHDGREHHNDTVYATWDACYDEVGT